MMIWAAIFSLTNSFRISLSNSFCSSFNLLWTQRIFYGNWWIRLVFLCEPFASRMFLYPTEESQHGCSFFYDNLDNPKFLSQNRVYRFFKFFCELVTLTHNSSLMDRHFNSKNHDTYFFRTWNYRRNKTRCSRLFQVHVW